MKVELNLPSLKADGPTQVALGSVMDQLATRLARWAESAMAKTDPADLTDEEVLALAVAAGCKTRTVITGDASYRIELVSPVSVTLVAGVWQVYQESNDEVGENNG